MKIKIADFLVVKMRDKLVILTMKLKNPWVISESKKILREIMFLYPIRHSMGILIIDFERIFK
jgi:hypothetical protein